MEYLDMPDRDSDVQSLFEVADDSLQDILAFHFYNMSMKNNVSEKQLWNCLPEKMPITFHWVRFYSKEQLTSEMGRLFEPIHSRVTFVFITSIFEAFLADLVNILNDKGKPQRLNSGGQELKGDRIPAKTLIRWAYQEALKYTNKNAEDMIRGLPFTFGIIDDARRLRNLIVHRKGLFNENYETDAINENNIVVCSHPDYNLYKRDKSLKIPVRLNKDAIITCNQAHIEALHLLHNSIQQRSFNFPGDGYSYREEKKPIEWGRSLRGT